MNPIALLLMAAAASSGADQGDPRGASIATAEVRATIVKAVVVRQASGPELTQDSPASQISRRGRTVLVEFQ